MLSSVCRPLFVVVVVVVFVVDVVVFVVIFKGNVDNLPQPLLVQPG